MAIQQKNVRFTLKSLITATAESLASFWKPALVAAPLLGTALFFAAGTHAQTSSNTAPPATDATTVAPIDAPAAARRGRRPKSKTKELVGRTASPTTTTDPATPTETTTPVAPIDAPDAGRRKGPKGDSGSDAQGSTEAPAPDTQPAGRGAKPKGAHDHGRTVTTPLIIGALSAATVLALVVSSGNDRPASP